MGTEFATASRRLALPYGLSPRYLSRVEAAAYVGVSPDTFDEEVAAGQWPQARRRGKKGTRITWDRVLIDLFADRDSGLAGADLPRSAGTGQPAPAAIVIQEAAEAAALAGVSHAAAVNRAKHGKQKAA